jgi:hypothetical protein
MVEKRVLDEKHIAGKFAKCKRALVDRCMGAWVAVAEGQYACMYAYTHGYNVDVYMCLWT